MTSEYVEPIACCHGSAVIKCGTTVHAEVITDVHCSPRIVFEFGSFSLYVDVSCNRHCTIIIKVIDA